MKWDEIARGREGLGVTLGVDVGKLTLWAVCRWSDGGLKHPWRAGNPMEIPSLVSLIKRVDVSRGLPTVAIESSGTYGESTSPSVGRLREIKVVRVGGTASRKLYAEVFDGVPSQHDGKDAAVVAELAALGKSTPWDYRPADAWEQELAYWVEWMVAHQQALTIWQGRLEGLVGITGRKRPSGTLVTLIIAGIEALWEPQALAADPQAAQRFARWGGRFLEPKKIRQLVDDESERGGSCPRSGSSVKSGITPSRRWRPERRASAEPAAVRPSR